MGLPERLKEWQDFDVVGHALGVALGIFPEDSSMSDYKGVFWSNNKVGNYLGHLLYELSYQEILEMDESEQRFRWKGIEVTSSRKENGT
jgi:hypothetical protein